MRISIAVKLFFGFLIVIFLNVFYVVVVSKLSDLNTIVTTLKSINETKNSLLRVENIHRDQNNYFIIFDKLKSQKSAENFHSNGGQVEILVDSIIGQMNQVRNLDTTVSLNEIAYQEKMELLGRIHESIYTLKSQTTAFKERFGQFESASNTLAGKKRSLEEERIRPLIAAAADSVDTLLHTTATMLDQQSLQRIRDISTLIENAKTLTMMILGGISAFALIFGLLFSRAITNSLRRLKESARILAKGNFEFSTKGYPADEIGELAMAFFDMSQELKSAQEQLIKSRRMAAIGEIVASVNHEINNPLMIISGNAQFLEMCMEDAPQDQKDRLKAIVEETERISKVTKKLRDIKNPVVEDYTTRGEQMINLDKSSQ